MRLNEWLTERGRHLFRWRGFTPLCLIPLFLLERQSFRYPLGSHNFDLMYEAFCVGVALMGVGIRVETIGHVPRGTSGRGRCGLRPKADSLNVTGMYSAVRNPLYLANFLIFTGFTLMSQSWELVLINSFIFGLAYLPIILREEEFLQETFGNAYADYVAAVPCFIPRFRLWRPPDLPFNLKMVIRREHDTWMSTTVVFFFLELLREFTITGTIPVHWPWVFGASAVSCVWLVIKVLKYSTSLLKAEESVVLN